MAVCSSKPRLSTGWHSFLGAHSPHSSSFSFAYVAVVSVHVLPAFSFSHSHSPILLAPLASDLWWK